MPTYEYRCPKGHHFERFYRTISAGAAELPCPECGALAERRLSAGAGLVFKGSGFYLTDYGKNAHRKPAPEARSDKPEKSGETKGESAGERSGAAPKTDTSADSGATGASKAEKPSVPASPAAAPSAKPTAAPSKSKPKSE